VLKIDTLAKQLLFNTVRVFGTKKSGVQSTGTAFLLTHHFPEHGEETFLVTNKHVVADLESGQIAFTRADEQNLPQIGRTFAYRLEEDFGTVFDGHPSPDVDVTVLPISPLLQFSAKSGHPHYSPKITTEILLNQAEEDSVNAFASVAFVGYPIGLYDSVHQTPIVRRGTTATPVGLDFNGQPVFLIDASVFPGSSGSPVFTYAETWTGEMADLRLLGILAAVFQTTSEGELVEMPAPTQKQLRVETQQMVDLGIVFKGRVIREAIMASFAKKETELRRFQGLSSGKK
jgi:S1-C subfamily serine protease